MDGYHEWGKGFESESENALFVDLDIKAMAFDRIFAVPADSQCGNARFTYTLGSFLLEGCSWGF